MGPGDWSELGEEIGFSCVYGTECVFFLLLLISVFFYMYSIVRELCFKNTSKRYSLGLLLQA